MEKLDKRRSVIIGDFNLPDVNFNLATATGAGAKTTLILNYYIENINFNQLIPKDSESSIVLLRDKNSFQTLEH